MMAIWRVAALIVSSMIYTAVGGRVDSPLELKDILPQNPKEYDKMQPPKENGKPTTVHFHVTVMSLDSIDESSMTYAADIFFGQTWKDYRLRFPDNLTADYRLLPISWLRQMWRPDTFFKNAKKVTFQEMTIPNHYVWLYKDKSILYMVKLTLILSCSMNFKNYPHDTQQCAMKIESLSHTTDDLVFQWETQTPLAVDERIELPQLDLVSNTTGDCTQVYSTGNFTCLEVVFTLRRRLGYYLFHTYVPTCLIVIMSWISFWIRPEAVPARVTLGVTSLLTLSTQHANSQKSLPPVSYIKAIDVFMSGCTVFVFCSLMEYALVNVVLGDIIEGEESALKRGMRSIFTATRLISTKQAATSRDSTSNPELSNNIRPLSSVTGSNSTHDTSATHATEPLTVCRRAATAGSMILNDFQVHVHNEELATPCSNQVQRRRVSRASSIPNLNVILPDSSNPLASAVAAEGIEGSRSIKQNGRNNAVAVPSICNNVMAISAKMERSRKPLGCGSATACHSLQQVRRNRAIFIDRLSRIAFPVSFAILNLVYWSIFVEWF